MRATNLIVLVTHSFLSTTNRGVVVRYSSLSTTNRGVVVTYSSLSATNLFVLVAYSSVVATCLDFLGRSGAEEVDKVPIRATYLSFDADNSRLRPTNRPVPRRITRESTMSLPLHGANRAESAHKSSVVHSI